MRCVGEAKLISSLWMDERWQEGIRIVLCLESYCLDMIAEAMQCGDARRFESGSVERDAEVREQRRRCSDTEVVAYHS